MLRQLSSLTRSDRLRAGGWLVIAAGLVGAALFYWNAVRSADPTLDDTNALGYQRSMQHGMGVMMGQFGLILTEWQTTIASPAGEAVLIALGAAIVAGCFFRMAWVVDHDEQP